MTLFIIFFILATATYMLIDGQIAIPTQGCCGIFLILFVIIALPAIAMLMEAISIVISLF